MGPDFFLEERFEPSGVADSCPRAISLTRVTAFQPSRLTETMCSAVSISRSSAVHPRPPVASITADSASATPWTFALSPAAFETRFHTMEKSFQGV